MDKGYIETVCRKRYTNGSWTWKDTQTLHVRVQLKIFIYRSVGYQAVDNVAEKGVENRCTYLVLVLEIYSLSHTILLLEIYSSTCQFQYIWSISFFCSYVPFYCVNICFSSSRKDSLSNLYLASLVPRACEWYQSGKYCELFQITGNLEMKLVLHTSKIKFLPGAHSF